MIPLETRITVNNHVRDWITMIQGELDSTVHPFSEEMKLNFWQEFATEMKRRDLVQAQGEPPKEMNDVQGHNFEISECSFGQYQGIRYRAIPYDYLAWLVDVNKKLELYVRWRAKKERIVSQG